MLEEHTAPARATVPSGEGRNGTLPRPEPDNLRSPRWSKGVTVNRSESAIYHRTGPRGGSRCEIDDRPLGRAMSYRPARPSM